jgi:DNA-binding NarL/FixJ family response regulator
MPRFVIVDDNESLRRGIRLPLSSARPGWDIYEAVNGQEALIASVALYPEILLIDVSTPGMSGIETIMRIRELGLKPRVILLTAHDVQVFAAEARNVGADGCVTKSAVNRDLVAAIESVLSGHTFFSPDCGSAP